ncbi:hypothetical protein CC80DRAFT_528900 [Byssothecium circinans]|uniref:Uncharacterized protein n=1 Tax=Byssothecium circinans TaxID=147558 RepID=A0A6A5TNM7_9PLEO|nr:hypothetical protein CC80DRAFT_528900 [Byssothecium circinans]
MAMGPTLLGTLSTTMTPLLLVYLKALTNYLHRAQGLLLEAWTTSFKKETILKSFKATSIWPCNAKDSRESSTSVLSGKDWLKIKTLVRKAVRDEGSKEVQKLKRSLYYISVQNELLHAEVQGLQEALLIKKKQQKKSKPLDLQQRKEYHSSAEKKERERLRVEKREEKERIAAEKEAKKQRRIQQENSKKAIQTSQKGKRKASKPAAKPRQQKKQQVVVAEGAEDGGGEMARDLPPTITTRRGRNIKLPAKFQ